MVGPEFRCVGVVVRRLRKPPNTGGTCVPTAGTNACRAEIVANADVQSEHDNTATVNVCYTYDHSWYVDIADTHHAPGASEATVALVNVDNTWYLRAVTDDHVVPACDTNKT
ncbi:hypothetical protein H7J06_24525 [Mycobacterium hodleri]|uniref:hypothetical protein n=1 Tax=Mycolicibacterium hodleri TaxID=49897 RepID=UPI000AB6387D|nr:hypothetical protein [Mycolicibacterium hodleri]MCV7136142.1 hypothetical protein [Mycolicibacterium hodleri]